MTIKQATNEIPEFIPIIPKICTLINAEIAGGAALCAVANALSRGIQSFVIDDANRFGIPIVRDGDAQFIGNMQHHSCFWYNVASDYDIYTKCIPETARQIISTFRPSEIIRTERAITFAGGEHVEPCNPRIYQIITIASSAAEAVETYDLDQCAIIGRAALATGINRGTSDQPERLAKYYLRGFDCKGLAPELVTRAAGILREWFTGPKRHISEVSVQHTSNYSAAMASSVMDKQRACFMRGEPLERIICGDGASIATILAGEQSEYAADWTYRHLARISEIAETLACDAAAADRAREALTEGFDEFRAALAAIRLPPIA